MESKAIAKFVRISSQKAKLVADLIRGKNINKANDILTLTSKKAAFLIKKVLKSAISNAMQKKDNNESILFIKKIYINQGPTAKRWRARAQGRSVGIKKRTSHINIILDER